MPLLRVWSLEWHKDKGYYLLGDYKNLCVETKKLKWIDFEEGIAETEDSNYRLDGLWSDDA